MPDPATAAWREEALTRIAEFRALSTWLESEPEVPPDHPLAEAVEKQLRVAEKEANRRRSVFASLTGVGVERTRSRLDAAEAALLQLAPLTYVTSQLPSLAMHVNTHLEPPDLRRKAVETIRARQRTPAPRRSWRAKVDRPFLLTEIERRTLVAAVRAASSAARREEMRLRSFRNVLLMTSAFLIAVAVTMAVLAWRCPRLLPLCFTPDSPLRVVCPVKDFTLPKGPTADGEQPLVTYAQIAHTVSHWDVPLVMLLGTIAAGIAAATALRRIKGTSTPYSLPVALALLKLPTGAITAVLGILLMRGGFVPGLSNLDTSAQVLAWGVLFGYAQQVFTGLVDNQAQTVLESVRKPPAGAPADDATPTS